MFYYLFGDTPYEFYITICGVVLFVAIYSYRRTTRSRRTIIADRILNLFQNDAARMNILTRRSIATYDVDRIVPSAIIRRALEAAILAPNHHLTEPWRYYNCGRDTLERMARYLETTNNPRAAEHLRTSVPHIMVVTQKDQENDNVITTLEDRAAVAASVQNLMLSLHADGVATKWITGAMQIPDDSMLKIVGADLITEQLVASVWFGYPLDPKKNPPAPQRKLGVDGIFTDLS